MRAVLFDIGGVLERVGPPDWAEHWRQRLGLSVADFDGAVSRAHGGGLVTTGGVSEAQLRAAYADALRLSPTQTTELMGDVWDWYCGELDGPLVAYIRALRPRVRTGLLSNSADGARREETRRYAFPNLVDDIVYSHEVGLAKPDLRIYALACSRLSVEPFETVFVDDLAENVDAANHAGLTGMLHENTPATIAALERLIDPAPD